MPLPQKPLCPKEVADVLNRSPRWVRRMCRQGRIATLPLGTPYMIPFSEIERLLSSSK